MLVAIGLIWFIYPMEDSVDDEQEFEDPDEVVVGFWRSMDQGNAEEMLDLTEDPFRTELENDLGELSEESQRDWSEHFGNEVAIYIDILDVNTIGTESSVDAEVTWRYEAEDAGSWTFEESYDLLELDGRWRIVERKPL